MVFSVSLIPRRRSALGLAFLMGFLPLVRAQSPAEAAPGERIGDYVLQPLDLIRVRIYNEPNLDREVRISGDYRVNLPLIGSVDLNDQTIQQAQDQISALYDRDFLVNPQVNVIVLDYARRTVNVMGAVGAPGEIAFPREEEMSLLSAISRAGGFSRLGDRKRVRLTRKVKDEPAVTFVIDVNELIEGESGDLWPLQTSDVIYVPERFF